MASTYEKKSRRMNVKMARLASTGNLTALAFSAGFYLLDMKIIGILMISLAVLAFCILISTSVHGIAAGRPVDDKERDLMQRSYYFSYWIIGTVLILGLMALQLFDSISEYIQAARPREFLFWAVMSMVLVVPAAVLAWQMPTEETEE